MKKHIGLYALALMLFFNGCTVDDTSTEDTIESVKTTTENDDAADESTYTVESHHQGEQCLVCHDTVNGTVESESRFNMGGTVYTAIDANNSENLADGHTIRLVLENTGTIVDFINTKESASDDDDDDEEGPGTANSYLAADTGTINSYTAQVLDADGTVVNSSIENSHTVDRLDCNRCHTADGVEGAPGRMVNFSYTAPEDSGDTIATEDTAQSPGFLDDVMPVLTAKCISCHSSTSTIGGDFIVSDTLATYTNIMSFVDTAAVDGSVVLQKLDGTLTHLYKPGTASAEYQTLYGWIASGAENN